MQRNPITPEGHERLAKEVKHCKSVLRPQVVKDIEEARAHGDLSENAEYDAAKDRQGLLEARIVDLETKLATAEIIDVTLMPQGERVIFGTTVGLMDLDTEAELKYRVVSEYEADVKKGLVSYTSPIGRALIGKEVGEEVRVHTPGGERLLEILDIHFR
ncbi:MAG: transcription elongation factor GreA [Proteobacteria bacterium]|nr:transcription elongation factor GreA [Pseudomonadota bacterium]MCP4920167.1 transcription elongation factor GreA [Pseudomonadota bacterium]